jgi:hypothetical protein
VTVAAVETIPVAIGVPDGAYGGFSHARSRYTPTGVPVTHGAPVIVNDAIR